MNTDRAAEMREEILVAIQEALDGVHFPDMLDVERAEIEGGIADNVMQVLEGRLAQPAPEEVEKLLNKLERGCVWAKTMRFIDEGATDAIMTEAATLLRCQAGEIARLNEEAINLANNVLAEKDHIKALEAELSRLRADRDGVIEECAKVAEGMNSHGKFIADHLRTLQSPPERRDVTEGGRHTAILEALRSELMAQHIDAGTEDSDFELIIPAGKTPRTAYVKIDLSALAEAALAVKP